ncbi:MAG TPA: TrbC/VirB2 family protein [Rickettsiales bacterium]|nr:TrbC/VirB2 family protein [Rickettsiales bacterium]
MNGRITIFHFLSGRIRRWQVMCAVMLAALLLPGYAAAGEISDTICVITNAMNGTTGKALASVAIIGVGIMLMFGRASWGSGFIIAAGVALIFGAASIMQALGHNYACTASAAPTFTCNGATPVGNLFEMNQTIQQTTDPVGAVFGHVLFFFKSTIGQVMSSMYCAMADALRLPLSAAVTLFITVFGAMIMGGISRLTMKEASVVLFKVALIWAFAMNADWGIGVAYKFFMNFAEEATNIVLAAIPSGGAVPSLTQPDNIILSVFSGASSGNMAQTTGATLTNVPPVCIFWAALFLYLMLYFMPFLVIFVIIAIIGYIGNFCRALLNYLTAIVLISFLFVFAPFFMSFALFRTTMPLFQAWLKHLVSFTLQMVVMFGFMAVLAMLPIAQFFIQLISVLKEYTGTLGIPPLTVPVHFCSVCEYNITPAGLNTPASIACVLHKAATMKQAEDAGYMLSTDHNYYVIPLLNLLQHSDFVIFAITQALAIYIISKVLGDFIKKAPNLAKELSGQGVGLALGAGGTPQGLNLPGIESIQAGYAAFRQNALKRPQGGAGLISTIRDPRNMGRNLKKRLANGIFGYEQENEEGEMVRHGGMIAALKHGGADERGIAGRAAKNAKALAEMRAKRASLDADRAHKVLQDAEAMRDQALAEMERLRQIGASEQDIAAARKALQRLNKNLDWAGRKAEEYKEVARFRNNQYSMATMPGAHGETLRAGFFENRRDGKLFKESSMDPGRYSQGDQTKEAYDKMMARHKKKSISGSVEENKSLGFIKFVPSQEIEQIAQRDTAHRQTMKMQQAVVNGRIGQMEARLKSANLSDGDRMRLQAMLDSAKTHVGLATSESELEHIAAGLNSINV